MQKNEDTRVRFSIRNKLFSGFFCLLLILVVTVVITLYELSGTISFSKNLKDRSLPTFDSIQNIIIGVYDAEASLTLWILTHDDKQKAEYQRIWLSLDKERSDVDQYATEWNSPTLLTKWQEIQSMLTQLYNLEEKLLKNVNSDTTGKENQAALLSEIDKEIEQIQNSLGNMALSKSTGLVNQLNQRLISDLNNVITGLSVLSITQWLSLLLGIVISVMVTVITSRSIVKPILSAMQIAFRISNGEKNIEIETVGNDETANLLVTLKTMYSNILASEEKLKASETKIQSILDNLQQRIREYRNYIAAVASGDLTNRMSINGNDDLSQLGLHLNAMTESLSKIALQIVSATNEISTGLNQLESASTSQAASALQQASSVAEVSSVVEEIKATSRQTLEKASALGESAEKTHQESEKGKTSVDDMTDSMRSLQEKIQKISDTILNLSEKTQQIGEITNVVSDIAKQSKMLALNAAIEAAKAGEVGKGFAVVAAEVKELADKSQGSTDRVQKILQDIRSNAERAVLVTEEGTKSVALSLDRAEKLNQVMNVLSNVILQSSMASQQIVAAVRQESAGIDQIVTSITEIDKVTNQFSAATEQTKGASVNLAHVAQSLNKTVGIYKLSNQ